MRDAIVLIDECEALLGRADKRKATAFKAVEEFEGIMVLVTNHPDALDEGVERRIMYHLPFEVPDNELRRHDLPFESAIEVADADGSSSLVAEVEAYERQLIAGALAEAEGNTSRAAKALGVKRTTLQYKIQKYDLDEK